MTPSRRAICLVLLAAVACQPSADSTQLVVSIDSDYRAPDELDLVQVRVLEASAASDDAQIWAQEFPMAAQADLNSGIYALPTSFGLVPRAENRSAQVTVEVSGSRAGSVLVVQRVSTRFVQGRVLELPIYLHRACAGVDCASGETCRCPTGMSCTEPLCLNGFISPDDLREPGEPIPDAGPPDASPPDAGPDAEPDAGLCEGSLTRCGNACINTSLDPRFCGDCDTVCPPGEICDEGTCRNPGDCRDGQFSCTGFTYCDEDSGSCQVGCATNDQCSVNERCEAASHACICVTGYHDCGGTCRSDTSVNSCGSRCTPCRAPARGSADCSGGTCIVRCDTGLQLCDGECLDLQSDSQACGSCSNECAPGQVCQGGQCEDPSDCRTNGVGCRGFTYCDQSSGACEIGCSVDAQCGANERCATASHECECVSSFHECGGTCIPNDDVSACGASCVTCPQPAHSSAVCDRGNCLFRCDDGYEKCDGECVNKDNDARNCGRCGNACPAGHSCEDRTCVDPGDCRTNGVPCTGFSYCDSSTGKCTPGCSENSQCGSNERCNSSHDCVCQSGFHDCSGTCVSNSSVNSCGSRCTPCSAPNNATATCQAGSCGFRCDSGLDACDGICVHVATDGRHCGGCGNACIPGEHCEDGDCVDPNDCRTNGVACAGFRYCDDSTGRCEVGCGSDAQCGSNERCNSFHDCVCRSGFHDCSGECVSNSSVNSCGSRCSPCPAPTNGRAECNGGSCDIRCDFAFTECDGQCVDTESNPRFCGSCGNSCSGGEICTDGECIDPSDCRTNGVDCGSFQYCDEASGECKAGCELDAECGSNAHCQENHECACDPEFHDCNGTCRWDFSLNSCGSSCTACPAVPDGEVFCDGTACGVFCDSGYDFCDGSCVDTDADEAHCGSCDNSCASNQICDDGVCRTRNVGVSCDTDGDCVQGVCLHDECDTGICPGNPFPNGYCSIEDCRVDGCGPDATCIDLGNSSYCFDTCDDSDDCRDGYVCHRSASGLRICDLCLSDTHCPINYSCGADGQCFFDPPCSSIETFCDGSCVDTDTDEDHCGRCGNRCDAFETCFDGVCEGPPQQALGQPCTSFSQCPSSSSLSEVCITESTYGFPGGYCTLFGCTSNSQCPGDSRCIDIDHPDATSDLCFDGCSTSADCRSGYSCLTVDSERVCWASNVPVP